MTSLTTSFARRSCHLITDEIVAALGDKLKNTKVRGEALFVAQTCKLTSFRSARQIGILHLFIQHTSAALTINENCDPDVRTDMDRVLDKIVPVRSVPLSRLPSSWTRLIETALHLTGVLRLGSR